MAGYWASSFLSVVRDTVELQKHAKNQSRRMSINLLCDIKNTIFLTGHRGHTAVKRKIKRHLRFSPPRTS